MATKYLRLAVKGVRQFYCIESGSSAPMCPVFPTEIILCYVLICSVHIRNSCLRSIFVSLLKLGGGGGLGGVNSDVRCSL
jgi:hypothetical protein